MYFLLKLEIPTMCGLVKTSGQEEGAAVSLSLQSQQTSLPGWNFSCLRAPPRSFLIPWKFPWKSAANQIMCWILDFRVWWMFTHVLTLIGPLEWLFVIRNERGSLVIVTNCKSLGQKMFFAVVSTQRITWGNYGEQIHKIWSVCFWFPGGDKELLYQRKTNIKTTDPVFTKLHQNLSGTQYQYFQFWPFKYAAKSVCVPAGWQYLLSL